MKYILFFLSLAAFAQVPRPGMWNPSGGAVGGASSIAATQVLYGTGAGVAGSEAAFSYDAATNLLGVGVGTTAETAYLGRYSGGSFAALYLAIATPSSANYTLLSNAGLTILNSPAASVPLYFRQGNLDRALLAATTGNLLIATTTDSGYKADIAASGTVGTLRAWDQGGAGSTLVVVRAGAGQSGNLTTWQNSGGSTLASVSSSGGLLFPEAENTSGNWSVGNNLERVGSGFTYRFSSTTSYAGTADLSLSRKGPGVIQAGDGAANANGSFQGGFISRDGSAGVTGATCSSFKNGLCVAP